MKNVCYNSTRKVFMLKLSSSSHHSILAVSCRGIVSVEGTFNVEHVCVLRFVNGSTAFPFYTHFQTCYFYFVHCEESMFLKRTYYLFLVL